MSNSTLSKAGSTAFRLIIGRDKKMPVHGDPAREILETVVFVVTLVLMLKLFVAEAFVIPTGSMASTLWGDQIKVDCPECKHQFPVTASVSNGIRRRPAVVHCQNCGHAFAPSKTSDWNSGDRVLVAKYDYHIREPKRFDVPVFKFPEAPYHATELTAMNYIKRLIGLPGETIAIYNGDLYRTNTLLYPDRPRPENTNELWRKKGDFDFLYTNDSDAVDLFKNNGFEMIRKSPREILVVRRLVFDLDLAPASLEGRLKTRWHPSPGEDAGWEMTANGFRHQGGNFGWVRYHHLDVGWSESSAPVQPALINDHLAYNIYEHNNQPQPGNHWVSDLLVECDAEIQSAEDEVILELTKGGERYQAVFTAGKCKLLRYPPGDLARIEMAERPTKLTSAGKYALRLANFDSRLTVWVNGSPLDFGNEADYPTPNRTSFKPEKRDLEEPARVGAKGNVTCSKVQLWRDVYYTCPTYDPSCGVQTYYVQPDHFLCLGDNSASSSDGREWGLVPRRLMLGRAVVIYWPASRWGVIE